MSGEADLKAKKTDATRVDDGSENKDQKSAQDALLHPFLSQSIGKPEKCAALSSADGKVNFTDIYSKSADDSQNVCTVDLSSLQRQKQGGLDILNVDAATESSLYNLYARNLAFQDKQFTTNYGQSIKDMFGAVYGKGGEAPMSNAASQKLQSERQRELKNHKPGQHWVENGIAYQLDSKGNLLKVDSKDNVTWVGANGSAYEKHGNKEVWFKNGAEIRRSGDTYEYRNAHGDLTEVKGDAQTVIKHVGDLQFSQFDKVRKEQLALMDRAALRDMPAGMVAHANALAYIVDDANHNRFAKDSMKAGSFIISGDGKAYQILKGKVLVRDGSGWKDVGDNLPSFLKRNEDGSLQFDTVKINSDDSIFDSKHQLSMADQKAEATAEKDGRHVKMSVADGHIITKIDGTGTSDFDTKKHTYNEYDQHHKPILNYDFTKRTMHADGITFDHDHTHIGGTDFSIGKNGVYADATEKYLTGGSTINVNSIIGEVSAIANSPNITPDMICELRSKLSFLQTIHVDTIDTARQVDGATRVVEASLVRAEEKQAVQLAWQDRYRRAIA